MSLRVCVHHLDDRLGCNLFLINDEDRLASGGNYRNRSKGFFLFFFYLCIDDRLGCNLFLTSFFKKKNLFLTNDED